MSTLRNRGHEHYARARAIGVSRLTAYVSAGYRPDATSAGRLERRPDVAARLAELRARDPDNADPDAIVARLLRVADACGALGTAAGMKEARITLLEAYRLQCAAAAERKADPRHASFLALLYEAEAEHEEALIVRQEARAR